MRSGMKLAVACLGVLAVALEARCLSLCGDPTFDTIFSTTDGKLYVFKGGDYWHLSPKATGDGYRIADDYPQSISRSPWSALPRDVDASFTHYGEGKTYFFKGDQHWRYTGDSLDSGYPKQISQGFPNIPNELDLGFVCTGVNYFSKGDGVYNTYRSSPRTVSSVWSGLPTHLTGAVQLPNAAHTYFFKDNQYYKLSRSTQSVESASPPYPRDTKDFWFGCRSQPLFELPEAQRR